MTESPAAKLVAPKISKPMPDPVDLALSLPDFVSPSHWLLWAFNKVCGVNPVEWVASQISGDWEAVSKSASALHHVAEFQHTYATALKHGYEPMFKSWEGKAADACEKYLTEFADAVQEQVSALDKVARECESVAYGCWSTAKGIVSLLEALLDYGLMIAIEAAAVAAASWTVVGGAVNLAVLMSLIARAIKLWLKIVSMVGLAIALVMEFAGWTSGLLGALKGLDAHPLPKGTYDNKVV